MSNCPAIHKIHKWLHNSQWPNSTIHNSTTPVSAIRQHLVHYANSHFTAYHSFTLSVITKDERTWWWSSKKLKTGEDLYGSQSPTNFSSWQVSKHTRSKYRQIPDIRQQYAIIQCQTSTTIASLWWRQMNHIHTQTRSWTRTTSPIAAAMWSGVRKSASLYGKLTTDDVACARTNNVLRTSFRATASNNCCHQYKTQSACLYVTGIRHANSNQSITNAYN